MKKIDNCFICFCICLLALTLTPMQTHAQTVFPDVNSDEVADITDVSDLIDYLLNHQSTGATSEISRGSISVTDYGAVGDGVTDDTEAMELAFAEAARLHVALFVPAGTYIIRRPLTLKSGMEIYGEGFNSIIKKIPAAWHKLTDAIETGVYNDDADKTITLKVDGISGYHVGDHCYISSSDNPFDPMNVKARYCSYGEIAEINETPIVENGEIKYEIKFKSAFSDQKLGVVYRHPVGAVLSTSFPVLRSWANKDECINVFIHDLCLDGNRQTDGPTYNGVTYEPMEWTNGCIHFDAYSTNATNGISYKHHSYNHVVERCHLINSSFDGISEQGEGVLVVKDCVIENGAMHGVHMGTTFANAIITGNTMTGNGVRGAGVFFCQYVSNVVVENNSITSFNHGCSDEEFSTSGKFVIIRNNTFNDITSYVFDFLAANSRIPGGGLLITTNTINGLRDILFIGDYLDDAVFTRNTVNSVSKTPSSVVKVEASTNVVIVGNELPSGVSVSKPVISTYTTNLISTGNSWN